MRVASALSFVVLAFSSTVSGSENVAGIAATAFQLGLHREPLISVTVNGTGPFVFVLDTGSSHTFISDELARTLGADPVAKTTFATSIGTALRAVVKLEHLRVGALDASNLLASVVPQNIIDPRNRVRGVIGQDLLAAHRYLLDFETQQIIWDPPESSRPEGSSTFTLVLERERFIVELPQVGSMLRLVPDTGAEALVLFVRQDVKLPGITRSPGRAWLSTMTNQVEVRPINVQELRMGVATLWDVAAFLVDPNDQTGSNSDGLLPLHLFRRVTFDGPRLTLTIEPRSWGS